MSSAVFFAIGSLLCTVLVTNQLTRRRALIQFTFVLCSVSFVTRTGFEVSYNIVNVATVVFGTCTGTLSTLTVTETVASLEETQIYAQYNKEQIYSDLSSWMTILTCLFDAGIALISNVMADWVGFTATHIITGVFYFAFVVSYILICGLGPPLL